MDDALKREGLLNNCHSKAGEELLPLPHNIKDTVNPMGRNDKKYGPNIQMMLGPDEKELRTVLLNKLVELNRPLSEEEVMMEEKHCSLNVTAAIRGLLKKGLIVFDERGSLIGLYPVSALPTRHKVRLADGRSLFAMCAIDALGISCEFERDVLISSSCSKCDTKIRVNVVDGKISTCEPSTVRGLHIPLGEYIDWANSC